MFIKTVVFVQAEWNLNSLLRFQRLYCELMLLPETLVTETSFTVTNNPSFSVPM